MKHEVTIYSYCVDGENKSAADLNGIHASGTFSFDSNNTGLHLYDEIFSLQNADGNPSGTKALPNLCSMTAGDIMNIDGEWVLCASFGWRRISDSEARLWMELPSRERSRWARLSSENRVIQKV